jgi:glycine cleavage system H lipoate-binding protein
VDGIVVPRRLAYAGNHLWLDLREDDTCHIGVDAFLARTLGSVEMVEFVQARGTCRPTAVLTARGTDVRLVFPNAIHVLRANPALRAQPSRVVNDPYGGGWIFSGREICSGASSDAGGSARFGLRTGDDAVAWMHAEIGRLDRFVHATAGRPGPDGLPLSNDGGSPVPGVAGALSRADRLELVDEFFSLHAEAPWR